VKNITKGHSIKEATRKLIKDLSELAEIVSKYPFIMRILSALPKEDSDQYYHNYQALSREEISRRSSDPTPIDNEEHLWWQFLIGDACFPMRLNNLMKLIDSDIKNYGQLIVEKHIEQLGVLPKGVNAIELLTLLFSSSSLTFPPGHPFWLSLGVKDKGEWENLGAAKVVKLAEFAKTGKLNNVLKTFVKAMNSAYKRQGTSEKLVYTSDERVLHQEPYNYGVTIHGDKKVKHRPTIPLLTEKLSPEEVIDLVKKRGIEKSELTDTMWRLIFRLNDAFDESAEIGSKKGVSLNAYFGDDSTATRERKRLSRLKNKVNRLKAKKN